MLTTEEKLNRIIEMVEAITHQLDNILSLLPDNDALFEEFFGHCEAVE